MKIVPEFLLRHDLRLFVFVSTPTIDIEPKISATPQGAADIMYNRYEKDIWKLLQMILNSHIMIGEKFA